VWKYIFCIIFGYLLGSIPFGYIVGKIWKNIDIRKYGSGNIGATNVYRTIGPIPGIIVLFCDIGKGILPVFITKKFFSSPLFLIGVGISAIIGHSYSIFLKGKGGKSVSTSFGVILILFPKAAIFSFLIWLLTIFITRYVSLSSILGSFSLPFFIYFYYHDYILTFIGIVIFFLILYRHKENLKRIKNKKENKFIFPWMKK